MDQNELDSSLKDELSEAQQESMTIEVEVSQSDASDKPRGPGRPPVPPKWAQVMSLDKDHPPKMVIQDISAGIKLA